MASALVLCRVDHYRRYDAGTMPRGGANTKQGRGPWGSSSDPAGYVRIGVKLCGLHGPSRLTSSTRSPLDATEEHEVAKAALKGAGTQRVGGAMAKSISLVAMLLFYGCASTAL
jgi:hypothetical protein